MNAIINGIMKYPTIRILSLRLDLKNNTKHFKSSDIIIAWYAYIKNELFVKSLFSRMKSWVNPCDTQLTTDISPITTFTFDIKL